MRRSLVVLSALAVLLVTTSVALAATQTASGGNVTATFSFNGAYPTYRDLRLTIAEGGTVRYDQRVVSAPGVCGQYCAPVSTSAAHPSVSVLDLEDNGEENVVLGLYSGGAHCCFIDQVFSLDPTTMTYVKTEHDFGDPGARIADLGHNGRLEFLTADDWFAYAFTDFAASGLPMRILAFSDDRFINVTRRFPKLIAKDAALWLRAFKSEAKAHYPDSVGLIAAWAADEDELGHSAQVARYLARQARDGHLNSPLAPEVPQGTKFVAKLQRFLRLHGYLS